MNVAHFCTFPHGGAANAAIGQHLGLRDAGINSQFYYYRNQQADSISEIELDPAAGFQQLEFAETGAGLFPPLARRFHKSRQRKIYELYNKHLAVRPPQTETYSMAELPEPTELEWDRVDADVVHLHWISYCADYPSFFRSIPDSVPIVWSLHDTNAFTGGCHYTGGCVGYKFGCGSCPQVSQSGPRDVSRASYQAKQKALKNKQIQVVAPCDWMLEMAEASRIWPKQTSFHKIEYGLDLKQFCPGNQSEARSLLGIERDDRIVAFGAMDVENPRKGFQFVDEALVAMKSRLEHQGLPPKVTCLVFGAGKLKLLRSGLPIVELGFVGDLPTKRAIYQAADLLILPSLEDNQPQVGLEAMACGTPVVAFNTAGMPEYVIDQRTGLLAKAGDSRELGEKTAQLIADSSLSKRLGNGARNLIEDRFARSRQISRTIELYRSVTEQQQSRAA